MRMTCTQISKDIIRIIKNVLICVMDMTEHFETITKNKAILHLYLKLM